MYMYMYILVHMLMYRLIYTHEPVHIQVHLQRKSKSSQILVKHLIAGLGKTFLKCTYHVLRRRFSSLQNNACNASTCMIHAYTCKYKFLLYMYRERRTESELSSFSSVNGILNGVHVSGYERRSERSSYFSCERRTERSSLFSWTLPCLDTSDTIHIIHVLEHLNYHTEQKNMFTPVH